MKEYNLLKNKANPTRETQEGILKEIQNSKEPMTLTALADKTKTNIYAVKSSIEFFDKMGIIEVIVTSGGTTIIQNKMGDTNAGATTNSTAI